MIKHKLRREDGREIRQRAAWILRGRRAPSIDPQRDGDIQ